MKMTIVSIENKVASTGNSYKSISVNLTSSDGMTMAKKFAVFGDDAAKAEIGGVYDVTLGEPNARGQQNITSMTLTGKAEPQKQAAMPPQQAKTASFGVTDTGYNAEIGQKVKNEAIALSVAIQETSACLQAKATIVPDNVKDLFWAWIEKQLNPPKKTMVEQAKAMGAVEKTDFINDEIETLGELLTICLRDYDMGRLDTERILGQSLESVKDMTGALVFIRDQMKERVESKVQAKF